MNSRQTAKMRARAPALEEQQQRALGLRDGDLAPWLAQAFGGSVEDEPGGNVLAAERNFLPRITFQHFGKRQRRQRFPKRPLVGADAVERTFRTAQRQIEMSEAAQRFQQILEARALHVQVEESLLHRSRIAEQMRLIADHARLHGMKDLRERHFQRNGDQREAERLRQIESLPRQLAEVTPQLDPQSGVARLAAAADQTLHAFQVAERIARGDHELAALRPFITVGRVPHRRAQHFAPQPAGSGQQAKTLELGHVENVPHGYSHFHPPDRRLSLRISPRRNCPIPR